MNKTGKRKSGMLEGYLFFGCFLWGWSVWARSQCGDKHFPPVHLLLLLLSWTAGSFFCLTVFPLKLIFNIETEFIFLTRPQGREVIINAEAFVVKNHYISHLLIMLSICIHDFPALKTDSLLPLRISNWETQTWIQRKSIRQQKLATLWDARTFSLRLSDARLEILLEWGSHYPALQRLRWAPVVNKRAHGFILIVLGKATELCHLQGRKIKCPCGSTVDLTA